MEKKRLSTTGEVNKVYDDINKYVDEYIEDWKIKPSNLHKYFSDSKKVDSFLKKYKIDDIHNIKRVLHDVIEDRKHLEHDGIMKFESFSKLNEDLGKIKVPASDVNHERVLADLYNTSIGHINTINSADHYYDIKDFGKEISVVIYSEKDVESFKESLLPILIAETLSTNIDLHKVNVGLQSGKEVKCGLSVDLKGLISEDKLKESLAAKLPTEKVLPIIHSFINDYDILRSGKNYAYKQEYKGHHIWELKDKKAG